MLNIDYSTPRRFLMSVGITLMILGTLLYFSTSLFIVDRIDKNPEQLKGITEGEITSFRTPDEILNSSVIFIYLSFVLMIVGFVCLMMGISKWSRNEEY